MIFNTTNKLLSSNMFEKMFTEQLLRRCFIENQGPKTFEFIDIGSPKIYKCSDSVLIFG